ASQGATATFDYGDGDEKPYELVVQVEEYGAVVSAVIIDMGAAVAAADVSAAKFEVATAVPASFFAPASTVKRNITRAYPSATAAIDPQHRGAASGRYVVLELEYGANNANESSYLNFDFATFKNTQKPVASTYSVKQLSAIGGLPASTQYAFASLRQLIADDFARLTAADGLKYRLFTPQLAAGAKYPLVVWLHGAGEGGSDNAAQILANEGGTAFAAPAAQARHPAFVAAPQNPNSFSWIQGEGEGVLAMIHEILAANPAIDADRIYVLGCSMGGFMTFDTILADPELFAAAAPICPAVVSFIPALAAADYAKLLDLPMWLFQGGLDPTVSPADTQAAYDGLVAAGKVPGDSFKYTVFPTVDPYDEHWAWVPVLNDYYGGVPLGFMDWLFAQRKESVITYDITVTAEAGGTATGAGGYAAGASVTVTAVPDAGYSFAGWYEGGILVPGAGAAYTFTAASNRALAARFLSTAAQDSSDSTSNSPGTSSTSNITPTASPSPSPTPAPDDGEGDEPGATPGPGSAGATSGSVSGSEIPGARHDYQIDVSGGAPQVAADGTVTIPQGATADIEIGGGVSVATPGGTVVAPDGTIRVPVGSGAATASLPDGSSVRIPQGNVIFEDADTPLGFAYRYENPFIDVADGDWFYGNVQHAVENELFNGTSPTEFSPNGTMTRAMTVTVLYRMEGQPRAAGASPFADVPAGQWYSDAIAWGAANGIVLGFTETRFGGDEPVTREQIAAILQRYAAYKGDAAGEEADIGSFADAADVSGYALGAVRWSVAGGLIAGRENNNLAPQGNATRAEVAAIIQRYIG
ncbi:MAG: S-layer homology domain-containing protein, partial [Clostridiales bacterium]|nr:S-layer homology domain-containing protein [Clostridiales bacterium]